MLEIYDIKQEKIAIFEDDKQLFGFIQQIERIKLLRGDYQNSQSIWFFEHRCYEKLFMVHSHINGKPLTAIEKEAYTQQRDTIEIYKGEYAFPVQLIVTPELDVDELEKQWCQDYCKAHGFSIERIRESAPLDAVA